MFQANGLNFALTLVWVMGIVNAFNFMDNMDGAAATVGALAAAAVAVLSLVHGDVALAVVCGGLAGACAGFLPYNLAGPARIFLGDGGSLPIGFVVAASLMALSAGQDLGWPLLLASMLLVGTPVVDTALVLISRRRARVPMLTGGRDHVTHRLLPRLGSPPRVALVLGSLQAVLGVVAIGVVELGEGSVLAAWSVWFAASAAGVMLLETRSWAPGREEVAAGAAPTPSGGAPSRKWSLAIVEGALLVFLTIACGLSPIFFGFYDVSVWGPIALGVLAALLGMVVARPIVPSLPAATAVLALVVMWLWSLVSTRWAESADLAVIEANRWLLYAAVLAILVLLVRDDRLGKLLLACATAAVCGLAVYLAAVMAFGDGPGLFAGGRLNEPLGYVNGQAGYLLLGFWPLVAVAERPRRALTAGAALAAATFLAGLVLLAQTRAVVPAVLVTAFVLVLAVPGRAARLWALIFVGAGVGAAAGPIIDVYDGATGGGGVSSATLHTALLRLALCAAATGCAWAGARTLASRAGEGRGSGPARLSLAVAVAVLLVGGAVAVAALGDPVDKAKREYRAFVDLRVDTQASTRLTSGGGNRYDYWRVALRQFNSQPIRGLGAGNYKRTYFRERRTTEDIRQPHSIELQTLAELGLVGMAGLILFLGAVLFGFARRARRARTSATDTLLCVGAGGVFLTWLVHTSVDWLHLIPGVTGIALFAAAILLGPWRAERPAFGRPRYVVIAVSALLIVFGALLIGRTALADHYRSQASHEVRTDPRGAIERADDSLRLNDEALRTYYVKAAAEARLNRYQAARSVLREAIAREPHDFVTWGLLGDLAVRRGDRAAARRYYRRALRLNPKDPSLRELVKDPFSRR